MEYHPQVDASKPNRDAEVEAPPPALSVRIQLLQSARLTPCITGSKARQPQVERPIVTRTN